MLGWPDSLPVCCIVDNGVSIDGCSFVGYVSSFPINVPQWFLLGGSVALSLTEDECAIPNYSQVLYLHLLRCFETHLEPDKFGYVACG